MPRHRSARVRLAPGIYRDDAGVSIVAIAGDQRAERRYPRDTPIEILQRHRETLTAALRRARRPSSEAAPGTLAADAPAYLAAVRAMPSYQTRATYVQHWVAALGGLPRSAITPVHIRQQLQVWATEPQARYGKPYAPETLRHLLKVLRHLYTVLDGPDARNPARAVPLPSPPAVEPRAVPMAAVTAILRQMRKGGKTRARLAVIAYTGMGHAELRRLRPEDVRLDQGVVVARARRKGAGSAPRLIPLTRRARAALRLFVRLKAWGDFQRSSMHTAFRRACENAGYGDTDWRPYDLRHTFGTEVVLAGFDEKAAQELLGHASPSTTARYTMAAAQARSVAAVAAMDRRKRSDRSR